MHWTPGRVLASANTARTISKGERVEGADTLILAPDASIVASRYKYRAHRGSWSGPEEPEAPVPATSPVVLSLFKSGGSTALVARLYVSGASETMTALAGALGLSVAAVS